MPVEGNRQRRRFVNLARQFRGGHPCYVAPVTGEILKLLRPEKNPALQVAKQGLWIAEDGQGRVRGRIAATFDPRHAESLGEGAGWFGFFDADDAATTGFLVQHAWQWLQQQGATTMLGPADPDTNHECGCLVKGFDEIPYLMMPHQPAEYGTWLQQAGLIKAKDLLALETVADGFPLERLQPVVERSLQRGGFRLESITKKNLQAKLEEVRMIYNDSWRQNWGFLPMTKEEFHFEAEGLKFLLNPGLAQIAYRGDEAAGFILGAADLNLALHAIGSRLFPFGILRLPFLMKKIRRLRTIALGVRPAFRQRGLEVALVYTLTRNGLNQGFNQAEMSWVLEDNQAMLGLAKALKGRVSRRYRLFRPGPGFPADQKLSAAGSVPPGSEDVPE
ncbi:MAG: GNAT family N-acetyltransferase [Planctomycetota bacterium]|nr:MAG: GNAT family N-acetyltransferase [Planctomycetota bacterium]